MMQLIQNKVAGIRVPALGLLLALLAAGVLLAAHPAHAETTFTVDSTADYGDQTPGDGKCDTGTIMLIGERCTLRAAIQEANAFAGADTIEFDIAGTGPHTIVPTTQLPTITRPVTMNGYSQPGAQANTKAVGTNALLKVELSGASAPGAYGLVMGGANSTVKGLAINRWHHGIRIDGSNATGNRISGNYIGTDPTGTQSHGNATGIRVYYGSSNTIGGTTPAARNVISGNGQHGISMGDGGGAVNGNRISGNYIGTDASGTKDLGNAYDGVGIEGASNNTIGGTTAAERNVISGNDQNGISIYARGNKISSNYVGTDATGARDLGNAGHGVFVDGGRNNTVGGTTAGERNVVSGNETYGVRIQGADAAGNRITGNFIGTDKAGRIDLGNSGAGVSIYGAPGNVVGGTTAAARNVVSANDFQGVYIYGTDATGNRVVGNYVGTDASGTEDLGNYEQGVLISDAPNNVVGGTTDGERNLISGNDSEGVLVLDRGASGNTITGNFIGTDKTGTSPLGNVGDGVNVSEASDTTIGGTAAGAGNVVAYSTNGDGVQVYGDAATGNRVLSNSIFANARLGIELFGTAGPTPNDPDDADTGPNNLQNFSVLSSAKKNAAGTTTVRGTLDSTPEQDFRVQFFSNPSGTDEGKTLLGSQIVSTGGSGDASFAFSTTKTVRLGQNVTATATGPGGNTSELSAPKQVVTS